MPLQLSDLMMRLNPAPAMPAFTGGDTSQLEMERQRLQLMQQQFEEAKRKTAEEAEWRRTEEAGRMAREQLTNDRLQQQAAAAAQAKALEDRQKAFDELGKYRDAGDYEGMSMAAMKLNDLGGQAERLGQDPSGLPTYQVSLDPERDRAEQAGQAAQLAEHPTPDGREESTGDSLARMGAIGYDRTAGGRLDAEASPAGAPPMSAEGTFAQMLAATQQARETGQPARGPDQPDFMGGVPRGVIDTGAMNAQAQQRLGPVMAAIQKSYPDAYQGSVGGTSSAVQGLGFTPAKTMEEFGKLRAEPDKAIGEQLGRDNALELQRRQQEFALEKERMKANKPPKPLTPIQEQELIDKGSKQAEDAFKNTTIAQSLSNMQSADTIARLLDDDRPENDDYAINLLMVLGKNKGRQTEADAERMTGLGAASTTEQIKAWIKKHVEGGSYEPMKNAMKQFASDLRQQDRENVFSYIDHMQGAAENANHPLTASGYSGFVNRNLPDWILKEYDTEHPPEDKPATPTGSTPTPASATPGAPLPANSLTRNQDFMETLDAEAAQHHVDAHKILKIVMPESGGDPMAVNHKGSGAEGLLQMLPSIAQSYTNPHTGKPFTGSHELAQLPAAEQAPFIVKYFADRGVTTKSQPEDYALAVAAPDYIGMPRGTVITEYRDAKTRRQNPGWVPKDGGPITVGSILDFYGIHAGSAQAPHKPVRTTHPTLHPEGMTEAERQAKAGGTDDAKLLEGI